MTFIALIGSILALALGLITLLGERGYAFDLRRNRDRRSKRRAGGRRATDLARATAE
jgi:hypothetical protein